MTLPYSEGTWFAVPLRQGGFAIGVVARATAQGRVILCYFFGPHRTEIPSIAELERSKPQDAIRIARVGDLSLLRGDWPIIGQTTSWVRNDWPIPLFIRRSELSGVAWRVQYSDRDPSHVVEEVLTEDESDLERDCMYGSGAIEVVLTKALS